MHAPHVIVVSDLLTYVSPYIDAIIIISYTEVMIFFVLLRIQKLWPRLNATAEIASNS